MSKSRPRQRRRRRSERNDSVLSTSLLQGRGQDFFYGCSRILFVFVFVFVAVVASMKSAGSGASAFSVQLPPSQRASMYRILFPTRTVTALLGSQNSRDAEKDNNDDDDDEGESSSSSSSTDLDREVDAFQAEQEAAEKVMNRIMLPRRIGAAISSTIMAFAYAFLIGIFALNMMGLDLILDGGTAAGGGGGVRIGTLEERAFRNEVVKMTRDMKQAPVPLTPSASSSSSE